MDFYALKLIHEDHWYFCYYNMERQTLVCEECLHRPLYNARPVHRSDIEFILSDEEERMLVNVVRMNLFENTHIHALAVEYMELCAYKNVLLLDLPSELRKMVAEYAFEHTDDDEDEE